jgi:hypothetical protein
VCRNGVIGSGLSVWERRYWEWAECVGTALLGVGSVCRNGVNGSGLSVSERRYWEWAECVGTALLGVG